MILSFRCYLDSSGRRGCESSEVVCNAIRFVSARSCDTGTCWQKAGQHVYRIVDKLDNSVLHSSPGIAAHSTKLRTGYTNTPHFRLVARLDLLGFLRQSPGKPVSCLGRPWILTISTTFYRVAGKNWYFARCFGTVSPSFRGSFLWTGREYSG